MEQIIEHINVNLVPGGVPSICHASQYDEGRIIRAHLLDGILPHTLSGTETIILSMRKPDLSKHVYTLENSSSDYIDIVTTSDMCSVAGESECEFIITDSSNITGTANFKMKIESDAYGDSLVVKSSSGPIATFETDLAENLIKLDVDLEPVQDLHSYDGAWRAGIINQITVNRTKGDAGEYGPNVTRDWDYTKYYVGFSYNNYYAENMLTSYNVGNDIVSVTQSRNAYGIAFPIRAKPNHQYYLGCTFGGTVKLAASYFDSTGSLITYIYNIGDNRIITTPDNCSTLVLVVYDGAASGVPVSASNIFINDPATETSYIPYSNICPITGYDSAVLNRVAKNLLHNVLESIEVNGTTITVNEDKSITVSGTPSARVRVYINDLDHIKFGKKTRFSSGTMPSGTRVFCSRKINGSVDYPTISPALTLQPNIEYYDFRLEINTSYDGSAFTIYPQLEPGEVTTSYEPYISNPTPITVQFGQTVYEGHLDSTNRKVLVTKKGVKIKDLTWSYVSSFTYFSATVNDILSNTNAGHVLDGLMCEVYTNRTPTQAGSGNKNGSIAGFNNTLRIKDLAYDDKDDLINAVGDYLIVYPLAEPFYIDLSQDKIGEVESAPVASFETNLARALETSEHSFSCSQAEGTPTPDSPIPITGVSEITAYRTGKNLANITISVTNHWGTDTQELVSLLNTLPVGVYTISNKYRIDELPGNNKVQHGRFYLTAMIDGTQTQVLSYSVVTDTSPAVGKIYEESGTFEITASNKGKFNHAYRYCDQDTTHTGNDRGSYACYDIQLEKGSSATPYEPYSGESITVSLGGTYYGGKLVQKEDGSRKLVLTHGLISKAIADMDNTDAYPGWKNSGIRDMVGAGVDGRETGILNIGTTYAYNTKSTNDIVYLPRDRYNNLTQTQWIENYPNLVVQILVPLAEPIEVSLPDGDPLTTIAGENNVYCNTGDTAVKYYYNMVSDPIRIPALVGDNNVYSDAGDVTVEYYAIERR